MYKLNDEFANIYTSFIAQDKLELQVLRDIYESTDGANWTDNTGWPTTPAEWDSITSIDQVVGWYGVTTDNGDVVGLSFSNTEMNGTIPASLAHLKSLKTLKMSNHPALLGPLPDMTGLPLEDIQFYNVKLNQEFPQWVSTMTSLKTLKFDLTNLSGTIPDISNLVDLELFHVSRNNVTGTVPNSLSGLTSLKNVKVYKTPLSGEFPNMNNTRVANLLIYENEFSGALPEIPATTSFVYAYDNNFEGGVPSSYLTATGLTRLYLRDNQLTELPSFKDHPNASILQLTVHGNFLTFDQIEQNLDLSSPDTHGYATFTYAPQNTSEEVIEISAGGDRVIESDRNLGQYVQYQWQKWNGSTFENIINNANDKNYRVLDALVGDKFRCEMTNSHVSGVTIYSSTFEVKELLDDTPDDFTLTPLYNGNITAIKWRTAQPEGTTEEAFEGIYLFDYDEKYQLKEGIWGVDGPTGIETNTNKYRLTGLTYDLNGNIETLKRYDVLSDRKHNFKYDYNLNTDGTPAVDKQQNNRLQGIAGYAQYHYNSIGQLEAEVSEDGESKYVEYDVTGKVTAVYADENKTQLKVSYTYDDRGFRLSSFNTESDIKTWYIRDASGNVMSIYEEKVTDQLLSQTEVPVYGSGKVGVYYPQQDGSTAYELTDHLGNVRAVVKRNNITFTATMEETRELNYTNPRVEESQYFENLFSSEMYNLPPGLNHTSTDVVADPNRAAYLTGDPGRIIGPAITLQVNAGDTVNLTAYGKYESQASYAAPLALADIASALTGTYVGFNGQESAAALEDIFSAALSGFANGDSDLSPHAYMNYIYFDNDFNVLEKRKERLPEANSFTSDPESTNWHTFGNELNPYLDINQDGYLYVYVSNHTPGTKVYFDDISVTLSQKIVTQATDYYPFGSVARRLNTPNNYFNHEPKEGRSQFGKFYNYGYQGWFSMEDPETGWNSFEARMYNSITGRWNATDPYWQYHSPYLAMGNSPILYVDKDGRIVWSAIGAVVGGAIGAGFSIYDQIQNEGKSFEDLSWGRVGLAGVTGAAAGSGFGLLTSAGVLAAGEAADQVLAHGEVKSYTKIILSGAGGYIGGKTANLVHTGLRKVGLVGAINKVTAANSSSKLITQSTGRVHMSSNSIQNVRMVSDAMREGIGSTTGGFLTMEWKNYIPDISWPYDNFDDWMDMTFPVRQKNWDDGARIIIHPAQFKEGYSN
ncbi:hypothetical protein E1176_04390 [Fulvivirga sp. RKSG066]|nr:hypothetical protein [Fulvivirga aurantia]